MVSRIQTYVLGSCCCLAVTDRPGDGHQENIDVVCKSNVGHEKEREGERERHGRHVETSQTHTLSPYHMNSSADREFQHRGWETAKDWSRSQFSGIEHMKQGTRRFFIATDLNLSFKANYNSFYSILLVLFFSIEKNQWHLTGDNTSVHLENQAPAADMYCKWLGSSLNPPLIYEQPSSPSAVFILFFRWAPARHTSDGDSLPHFLCTAIFSDGWRTTFSPAYCVLLSVYRNSSRTPTKEQHPSSGTEDEGRRPKVRKQQSIFYCCGKQREASRPTSCKMSWAFSTASKRTNIWCSHPSGGNHRFKKPLEVKRKLFFLI